MTFEKTAYIEPEIEVIKFGSEDIITASTGDEKDPYTDDIF